MALIQKNRLVDKLRRQFGLLSSDVGATLANELVGVVIVDDVSGPDVISVELPSRATGNSNSAAGGAATRAKVGIQNPAGSGVDLFVTSVYYRGRAAGAQTVQLRSSAVLPASPNAGLRSWRDLRKPGNPTALIFDENATGSLGTLLWEGSVAANNDIYLAGLGFTLPEGEALLAQQGSDNLALEVITFFWIERLIQAP